jgi:hypothetical protein
MSSELTMTLMSAAEFLLSALLGFMFWKKGLHRRFPAMATYLALRVVSAPVLTALLSVQSQPWGKSYYAAYFYIFWAVYVLSAILLFFVCMEVFRSALAPFPGLVRFGVVIFRWTALVSVIVSLSNLSLSRFGLAKIPDISASLMRSVGILELCLLAFLCLSMNTLRLSVRDKAFGIALGFGLMASNDLIFSLLTSRMISLTAPLQFVYESVILGALGTWVAYCAIPEPVRKPIVMPVNSTIYRWNEIASALGHTGTQVAVQQPASSFFLTDVEHVVDRVLSRNLKNRESET